MQPVFVICRDDPLRLYWLHIYISTCEKDRVLRMDLVAGCVQLWIHSAEPPGEHRNENRKKKKKKKKQRAECLVESAPLRGLDTGS